MSIKCYYTWAQAWRLMILMTPQTLKSWASSTHRLWAQFFVFCFKDLFTYVWREREGEERNLDVRRAEHSIGCEKNRTFYRLPHAHPRGIQFKTWKCDLTGNRTSDLSVHRDNAQPSEPRQGARPQAHAWLLHWDCLESPGCADSMGKGALCTFLLTRVPVGKLGSQWWVKAPIISEQTRSWPRTSCVPLCLDGLMKNSFFLGLSINFST